MKKIDTSVEFRNKFLLIVSLSFFFFIIAYFIDFNSSSNLVEDTFFDLEQEKKMIAHEVDLLREELEVLDQKRDTFTRQIENLEEQNTKLIENELNRFAVSPKNRLNSGEVKVFSNEVIIDVDNPSRWSVLDTNSMLPLFDYGATIITQEPLNERDLVIGDIIFFETPFANETIVHRIVRIGQDIEGSFYTTRGDNNNNFDAGKVRFEDVKGVVVAIIY